MSTRTAFALFLLVVIGAIALGFGLTRRPGAPDLVWGKKGVLLVAPKILFR